MNTVPNFNALRKLVNKPDVGELVVTLDTHKMYQYSENHTWLPYDQSEVKISLYDINKQVVAQMPLLTSEQLDEAVTKVSAYIEQTQNTYYMLYGAELNYFTVFKIDNNTNERLADILIECLFGLGEGIIAIQPTDDNSAIECWIAHNNTSSILYLFSYDGGVVECKI